MLYLYFVLKYILIPVWQNTYNLAQYIKINIDLRIAMFTQNINLTKPTIS